MRKLQGLEAMGLEEEKRVLNVWKLSPGDRWRLYAAWIGRHRKQLREQLALLSADHDHDTREMEELRFVKAVVPPVIFLSPHFTLTYLECSSSSTYSCAQQPSMV